MKDITKQWLEFAEVDIKCCQNNLDDDFVTNTVVFHSQQAVEKCFKAIIEEKGMNIPRIHNLMRLHKFIQDLVQFSIDLDLLANLDEVYTSARYPSDLGLMPNGKPTTTEASEMYEFALFIYNKTVEMINLKR